jgi:acyl dehydratase
VSTADRAVLGIDDLAGRVGQTLGTAGWRTIDQAAIDSFAAVTGDHQWIHVDPERAGSGPFGTTIAHGFLTLSLCAVVVEEAVEVRGTSMQVNYGLDRVRFPAPVPVGSRVRGVVELASVEEIPAGVQAVLRVVIEVDGADKPACVADLVLRFYSDTDRGNARP